MLGYLIVAAIVGFIVGGIVGYQVCRNSPSARAKIDAAYIKGKAEAEGLAKKIKK